MSTLVAALAATLLAGCTGGSEARVPEVAEVEALVAQAYGSRGDAAALCDLASSQGNCDVLLQEAGTAPTAQPEIVCTQPYEGHDNYTPGLLVRTVTDDGSGDDITHDTIAIDTPEGPKLMNVVYWVSSKVSDGNTTDDAIDFTC
ncbi:hypothetical protein [Demequina sp. NBRC 110054]|uniref:hypothetical protein n=1 Tax=Demequina sp. NBRC 110054 TaxID=1570343 RepID=UPI0011779ADE|nr:hypothetical protein [Demequina sp. NBRC 110054]